jgi:hypothetical protein
MRIPDRFAQGDFIRAIVYWSSSTRQDGPTIARAPMASSPPGTPRTGLQPYISATSCASKIVCGIAAGSYQGSAATNMPPDLSGRSGRLAKCSAVADGTTVRSTLAHTGASLTIAVCSGNREARPSGITASGLEKISGQACFIAPQTLPPSSLRAVRRLSSVPALPTFAGVAEE